MVEIQLSPTEIYSGAQAGVLRQVQNLTRDGSKPTRGLENNASTGNCTSKACSQSRP